MNRIISDTAEYGCYLFDHSCKPLLEKFMSTVQPEDIGHDFSTHNKVDNVELIQVNEHIAGHPIEHIGAKLRASMTAMKAIQTTIQQPIMA